MKVGHVIAGMRCRHAADILKTLQKLLRPALQYCLTRGLSLNLSEEIVLTVLPLHQLQVTERILMHLTTTTTPSMLLR